MNIQIAKQRIHQVINVDSINNESFDFMATHIPFRKISYKEGCNTQKKESISEDDIFYKIFEDSSVADKHQLIIVEGFSGSGKSHFIRWIDTNLKSKGYDEKNNKVLMIRRSENTLKGTIKQLLSMDEVKNLKNKELYERLVNANVTISDVKFKEEIFSKFIVEINVSDEKFLNSLEKKRLAALLNNDLYKTKIMRLDGPIERIFSKISNSSVSNIDLIAEFKKEDFIISPGFFDDMRGTADARAVSIAKKLVSDDLDDDLLDRIVDFMNSNVESVIQSCAGIEPGDFQQIFMEIRQELFRQGKNLVLLIEDITSFTGINQALLSALAVEHTGLYDTERMCKLISIVGTTSEYYKSFRDNYKDRITTQITIENDSIGQIKDDLYLFFGKYLNAVSVDASELREWCLKTGADDKEMPIHIPDSSVWDSIDYYGNKISLYPFTKTAILNLYNNMGENKTPRYVLLDIIKPAIDELTSEKSTFLRYLRNRRNIIGENAESRIRDVISRISVEGKDEYTERALALVGFWGNGQLTKEKETISGIHKYVFDDFGLSDLWDALYIVVDENKSSPSLTINDPDVSQPTPVINVKPVNKKYESFKTILNDWFYEKKLFVEPRYVKEELSKFIFNTINWQQLGISNHRIEMIKKSGFESSFISFERQEKNEGKGLLYLESSHEVYDVFRAIGQWIYLGNKTWAFDDSFNAIFILTSWLEKNKDKIASIIKDYKKDDVPDYVKIAMCGLVYEKILNGEFVDLKIEDISLDKIITPIRKNEMPKNTNWKGVIDYGGTISTELSMYNTVINYFNISQGSGGSVKFLNYCGLEKTFSTMKRKDFTLPNIDIEEYKYARDKIIAKYYVNLVKKVIALIDIEKKQIEIAKEKVFNKFGLEANDDINVTDVRELLDEISEFYKKGEQTGYMMNSLQNEVDNLNKNANIIVKNLSKLKIQDNSSNIDSLMILSSRDDVILANLLNLLNDVERNVENNYPILQKDYESLTKNGLWIDEDPRFAEYEKLLNDCVSELGD